MGEKIKYDFNGFDEDGIHKDTGKYYDLNDFNSYGINVKTKTIEILKIYMILKVLINMVIM